MHAIEVSERVLTPEDGLLLGNGDLSVSVYQTADRIVWRFGKGDVWDRRLDLADDPKPAHIDEIARGIKEEGWKCGPYGGPVEATRGTKDPKRMQELCQGSPPSYKRRPYPCPKPVGELAMHLPPDQTGLKIRQRLEIEDARLTIACTWSSGAGVDVECFVPPSPNVLVVQWKVRGWDARTRTGHTKPPVWFSLYRWADPTIQEFAARFFADSRHSAFYDLNDAKVTPLPPPAFRQEAGVPCVEQAYPAEPTFPQGFRVLMAPFAPVATIEGVHMDAVREARLHLLPGKDTTEGSLAVAVATSSDRGGPAQEVERVRARLGEKPSEAIAAWAEENRKATREFWSRSRVAIADPVLENLWYETLHARRCAYRKDTVPPGLLLPSTVRDYSHWHGDYHTNYNIQQPFWGDYAANQVDLGDSFFEVMKWMLPMGRRIARDYYGCRGAFIQLTGYPIRTEEDVLGIAPMGRMAYMTGWMANTYWWRYRYTLDRDWLRETGYPVIRDCALFYTDFLKKGEDGLYHAFPSNQGEDGFSGNPKDYTDRPQVMQHARYCLRIALLASEALGTDPELRAEWRDRLEHCAGDDGRPPVKLAGLEKLCYEANPPEFGMGRPYQPHAKPPEGKPWPPPGEWVHEWYFGQFPWISMQRLRAGGFIAERDFAAFREMVAKWRHPNGVVWAMAVGDYGNGGAWTESLGVIAPLQEMMLQSWDGALRIFPAWPKDVDARFERLRAEGAFLVTASWSKGQVSEVQITSEKGERCCVYVPWPGGMQVLDEAGRPVPLTPEEGGRASFPTRAGCTYTLERR